MWSLLFYSFKFEIDQRLYLQLFSIKRCRHFNSKVPTAFRVGPQAEPHISHFLSVLQCQVSLGLKTISLRVITFIWLLERQESKSVLKQ